MSIEKYNIIQIALLKVFLLLRISTADYVEEKVMNVRKSRDKASRNQLHTTCESNLILSMKIIDEAKIHQ